MASSVVDSGSTEPNEFECSVCHDHFTEPKLLPCGHLLCKQCLLNWMKTKDDACCPLCRDIIVSATDRQSKSLEDVANELPTDLSMELVLEADRILSKQHNCCVCEDVLATSMCLNCKEMFCKMCKKAHMKMSVSKHHTVEDLSSLTAEKLSATHSSPCSTHPEETPKLFCPTHGESVCLLCATSKHRSCPEVKDLGEKMEETRALLKQLGTKLTKGESELDKAINELDQHLQDIEKYAEAAIAEIEEMCDQLNALVKENSQRMKERVVNARAEVREAVKEGRNCLLQRQTKLTTHGQVIQRVRGVKNHEVAATMLTKMKKRVNDLEYSTSLPKDAKVVSAFKFIPNPTAMAQIKQDLTKLGEVKILPANIKAISDSNRKVDFVFHDNRGTSVILSNNNHTASKARKDPLNGIVLSRDPMDLNTLYEVKIDVQVPGRHSSSVWRSILVGVADISPANMTLPSCCADSMTWPVWISSSYTCRGSSKDRNNRVGAALARLSKNSRVGLALDSARCLHFYVDGQDQGIAARNLPDPCYAMFDVVDEYEQITALPTTRLGV